MLFYIARRFSYMVLTLREQLRAYTKIDFLLIKRSWQPTLSLPIDPQSSPNCRPFGMIFV